MFLSRRLSTVLRLGCYFSLLTMGFVILQSLFTEAPLEDNSSLSMEKKDAKMASDLYRKTDNTPGRFEDVLYIRLAKENPITTATTIRPGHVDGAKDDDTLPPPPTHVSDRFVSHSGPTSTVPAKDPCVLLVVPYSRSKNGQKLEEELESNKIPYLTYNLASESRMSLTRYDSNIHFTVSRFSVIVFDHYRTYLRLEPSNRAHLLEISRRFRIGRVFFTISTNENTLLREFGVGIVPVVSVQNVSLNARISSHLRLTRPRSGTYIPSVKAKRWTKIMTRNKSFKPVLMGLSRKARKKYTKSSFALLKEENGARQFWFGIDFDFWLFHLLFLDALHFASNGSIFLPLDRFIQIDIDDIFTGKIGIRLTPSDVGNLIETQSWIRSHVPGFRFYLGYSSNFFQKGLKLENLGDDYLVGNASEFLWFGHMPSHQQAHKYSNSQDLIRDMEQNKRFGISHGLSFVHQYSVASHHSGVYPVHLPLYEAWKQVYNVSVTSTYLYPTYRPAYGIKGFTYKGIKVLPRRVCGVYTTVNTAEEYEGGLASLFASSQGGSVFQTVVNNRYFYDAYVQLRK
eukprot:m.191236 g.191236  ORF g.191236 m.191236 type:complete len:569 (+) comp39443_c0_seq2:68-1774(+)